MARGWESKSVEAQQEESARSGGDPKRRALTPEAVAAHQEREALELARRRARADLKTATRPAQRQMLLQALAAIDERLARLEPGP